MKTTVKCKVTSPNSGTPGVQQRTPVPSVLATVHRFKGRKRKEKGGGGWQRGETMDSDNRGTQKEEVHRGGERDGVYGWLTVGLTAVSLCNASLILNIACKVGRT